MFLFQKAREKFAEIQAARNEKRDAQSVYRSAVLALSSTDDVMTAIATLPSDAALSRSDVQRVNDDAFRRLSERFLDGDILTEDEERELMAASESLGIKQERLDAEFKDILYRLVVSKVNDGRMPILQRSDARIVLKRNEVAHATMFVSLMKEQTLREYRGGYSGFSFQVVKGVRYHTGTTRGHSVVVGTQIITEDTGVLTITSSRAVFTGSRKNLEFAYPKLLQVQVFTDGIRLAVSNRQQPSLFKLDSGDVAAAIINAAAQKMLD